LARVAAITPHTLLLPAIVGTPKPLCYFAGIVAPPGIGKSDANGIGAELVPAPEYVSDQVPPGSGEGLAELLFDLVEEPNDDGKGSHKVKRQVRHNAYIYADEGQVLADLGSRSGSVLLPVIREIWSGVALGQQNASVERNRRVPAYSYNYGIVAGFQVARVGPLLDDAEAGTPQRFGWAYAIDPTVPEDLPEWPGELRWPWPPIVKSGEYLALEPSIAKEIRAADLARVRGMAPTQVLDAQAGLYRLKVAGCLSLLAGRKEITTEDWDLAGMVKTSSDAVRTRIVADVATTTQESNRAKGVAAGQRKVTETEVVDEDRVRKACARIETVLLRDGPLAAGGLRRTVGRPHREHFEEAIERLQAAGRIKSEEIQHQGQTGVRYEMT
jgi:hypothetical protein